ncbi:hypothetical protein HELRODRAFT_180897 [Helobdella robusta]|uniref:Uncharacterized protein n=1 Tax=Helobdella robusta TaxID=6412 RepID=T1FGE0_HELRO|nr:hypothetical protein HELRODRAFT_180897 [Helobdella robusta]ESN93372.1 hypothetical protein HELRODRAFT_180897 [Helobdella robusta]
MKSSSTAMKLWKINFCGWVNWVDTNQMVAEMFSPKRNYFFKFFKHSAAISSSDVDGNQIAGDVSLILTDVSFVEYVGIADVHSQQPHLLKNAEQRGIHEKGKSIWIVAFIINMMAVGDVEEGGDVEGVKF